MRHPQATPPYTAIPLTADVSALADRRHVRTVQLTFYANFQLPKDLALSPHFDAGLAGSACDSAIFSPYFPMLVIADSRSVTVMYGTMPVVTLYINASAFDVA